MKFGFKVEAARFVARPNRFLVLAERADGQSIRAHCADPGRLRELLTPGATVYVSPAVGAKRRTAYDLRFVVHPQSRKLVSLDTRLPNGVVAEALAHGALPMFAPYECVRAEAPIPGKFGAVRSRVDFLLTDGKRGRCWVEVKSVTLVEAGRAEFPDAPTERGVRHLRELSHLAQHSADRAAVLFVVQRDDAYVLAARRQTDPAFADALAQAHVAGVELYAYTCSLTLDSIELKESIPLDITLPMLADMPSWNDGEQVED